MLADVIETSCLNDKRICVQKTSCFANLKELKLNFSMLSPHTLIISEILPNWNCQEIIFAEDPFVRLFEKRGSNAFRDSPACTIHC